MYIFENFEYSTKENNLIVHENMNHGNSLTVTVLEAVDEIVDLNIRKRKNISRNKNSNVEKVKYRL